MEALRSLLEMGNMKEAVALVPDELGTPLALVNATLLQFEISAEMSSSGPSPA
mgnify:CR=1 FL=1